MRGFASYINRSQGLFTQIPFVCLPVIPTITIFFCLRLLSSGCFMLFDVAKCFDSQGHRLILNNEFLRTWQQ